MTLQTCTETQEDSSGEERENHPGIRSRSHLQFVFVSLTVLTMLESSTDFQSFPVLYFQQSNTLLISTAPLEQKTDEKVVKQKSSLKACIGFYDIRASIITGASNFTISSNILRIPKRSTWNSVSDQHAKFRNKIEMTGGCAWSLEVAMRVSGAASRLKWQQKHESKEGEEGEKLNLDAEGMG